MALRRETQKLQPNAAWALQIYVERLTNEKNSVFLKNGGRA